jgi:hypothetical protein
MSKRAENEQEKAIAKRLCTETGFQYLRNKVLDHPLVKNQLTHHSEAVAVITQCGAFGGFLSVFWILGYFGFSIIWVFIGTGILAFREIRKNKRKCDLEKHRIKVDMMTERLRDGVVVKPEEESLLESAVPNTTKTEESKSLKTSNSADFEDFALVGMEIERAEWLNSFLKDMWPFLGLHIKGILENMVEPLVQSMEPKQVLSGFKFNYIHMGVSPPRINSVTAFRPRNDEKNGLKRVVLDMDLALCSNDMSINFEVLGMKMGVEDVVFSGPCRIELSPLFPAPPFFGSIAISFTECPKIDFDLTGVANIVEVPGLNSILHSTIDQVFSGMFVLPAKFIVPMMSNEQMDDLNLKPYDLMHPFAKGCLFIHVKSAVDLVAKDNLAIGGMKLKKGKSDPYVKIKVGNQEEKTLTIKKTLNPTWNEKFCMLVSAPALQKVKIEAWDDDDDVPLNSDPDALGDIEIPISSIHPNKVVNQVWDLANTESGRLFVDFYWIPLVPIGENKENCLKTVTSIVVESVYGIENHLQKKFMYLTVSIEDQKKVVETHAMQNSMPELVYQKNFYFQEELDDKNSTVPGLKTRKVCLKSSTGEEIAHANLEYDCSCYDEYLSEYFDLKLAYIDKKFKNMPAPTVKVAVRVMLAEGEIIYQAPGLSPYF